MNNRKIAFGFLLILIASFGAYAQQDSEKDFETELVDGGKSVSIAYYTGKNANIRIPQRINNLPVTVIGEGAFMDSKLSGVAIPNGVTVIESYAFSDNNIAGVAIPNSVVSIEEKAFFRNKIANLTIPASVKSIGKEAFAVNNLGNVTIPPGVTLIGDRAFAWNKLTNITIPASVTVIEGEAFIGNSITRITIGENVDFKYEAASQEGPFDGGFANFYNSNRRRAGTYTYVSGRWSVN